MRLFNWFRRGSLERELDHELQYHFDRRVADLASSGIPEPEARRRIAAELGLAQIREEVRDVWLSRWLRAEWKQSETGREAKFYSLTAAGRRQLAVEKDSWARLSGAVDLIFEEGNR